jgi:hypothetical protein
MVNIDTGKELKPDDWCLSIMEDMVPEGMNNISDVNNLKFMYMYVFL